MNMTASGAGDRRGLSPFFPQGTAPQPLVHPPLTGWTEALTELRQHEGHLLLDPLLEECLACGGQGSWELPAHPRLPPWPTVEGALGGGWVWHLDPLSHPALRALDVHGLGLATPTSCWSHVHGESNYLKISRV